MKEVSEFSIDEVIQEIKDIVDFTERKEEYSNLTFFALLYLYVTVQIRESLKNNNVDSKYKFEDPERMKRLDVIFAKRYINAFHNWMSGKDVTNSWRKAFEFGKNEEGMIIQHLLLGMNAHINLDLGIATVEATSYDNDGNEAKCFYKNFNSIIKDFTIINEVLNDLTEAVEDCLAESSLIFKWIKKYGKGKQDLIANFSIKYARTGAWYFATFYRKNTILKAIEERDEIVSELAEKLKGNQSVLIKLLVILGILSEKNTVNKFIPKMKTALGDITKVKFDDI